MPTDKPAANPRQLNPIWRTTSLYQEILAASVAGWCANKIAVAPSRELILYIVDTADSVYREALRREEVEEPMRPRVECPF